LSLANFNVRETSESLMISEESEGLAELNGILGLKAWGSTSAGNSADAWAISDGAGGTLRGPPA
jgi:hypothetical protein